MFLSSLTLYIDISTDLVVCRYWIYLLFKFDSNIVVLKKKKTYDLFKTNARLLRFIRNIIIKKINTQGIAF